MGLSAARMALAALLRRQPDAVVLADAVEENAASVRILNNLGFQRIGSQPGNFCRDGQKLDIWNYQF